jgi:hypothetical protein
VQLMLTHAEASFIYLSKELVTWHGR